MSPPASPSQPRPPAASPPDPAQDSVSAEPPPATGWDDCPRCGEHWAPASPYCDNCGWVPGSALADGAAAGLEALPADQTTAPRMSPATTAALAGVAAAAAVVALWFGVGRTPAPVAAGAGKTGMAADGAMAGAGAALPAAAGSALPGASASVPTDALTAAATATPTAAPASAAASDMPPASAAPTPLPAPPAPPAPSAASAPPVTSLRTAVSQPAASGATAPGPGAAAQQELERFARTWLAEEAGAGPEQLDRLRALYAERLDYRGHAGADWAVVAADKAAFLRRWPQRQYQLLALRVLAPGPDDSVRVALQVRWQLDNHGRWRRGESLTLLSLRRIDGAWRIVGEAGA